MQSLARYISLYRVSNGFQVHTRGFHRNCQRASFAQFAQGRGPLYSLETTVAERVNDMLSYYGLQKWGFVIYRCTYEDDSAWDRFMHRLNARKDAVLKDVYDDKHLAYHLDWNVQQDFSLNHATKDEVRARFRAWVATDARAEMPTSSEDQDKLEGLLHENARYKYCIHVDAASLQSVLDGPLLPESDMRGVSYVNLIRADRAWDAWEKESAQALAAGAEEDSQDEGEMEIEGRTSYDVGWMKVLVDGLVPDVYETLVNDQMWNAFYVRPNEGVWTR
jgi:hypothetical protein